MSDEVTLTARRNIQLGEELTTDYSIWEADEDFVADWNCTCGGVLCRGRITGRDWMLPELKLRYDNHFALMISKRIARDRHPGNLDSPIAAGSIADG